MADGVSEREYREVTSFLYREAELIDARRLSEWLELLSDDARYRVTAPTLRSLEDPAGPEALLLDDDRASLAIRVEQQSKVRHTIAENPPWLTRRLVSNVLVERGPADDYAVASNLLVFRSRGVEASPHLIAARRLDRVRRAGSELRLVRRDARLDEVVVGVRSFGGFL